MNEKSIIKTVPEWKDIAMGLQILLSHYVIDIQENGIPDTKEAPYVSNASKFIMELTNDCLQGK